MADTGESDFGGYRIERELGSGGMGTVYLARHPRLPREDALKVLSDTHHDDPGFRARFLREAEIAARLQHPNLVAVRDRGEHAGQLWIAMQYVAGIDCAALVRRGPVDPARAVWIVAQAASGLDEVHRAGLLHRDVKPANILISEQPGVADRVLVTDFGIARPADDSSTLDGAIGFSATLAYAAPEQINGRPVDQRTDVYALGCTLYQLLTGKLPFPRDTPGAVLYAHLNEPPPLPSSGNRSVPVGFDAVIAIAMAKDPDARFRSCGALAAAAREVLTPTVVADTFAPGRRRRKWAAALSVIVFAGAALTAFTVLDGRQRAPEANQPHADGFDPEQWGEYADMVKVFAELLPPSSYTTGYQDLSNCVPVEYGTSGEVLPFEQKVTVGDLMCYGDQTPVFTLDVICRTDRTPLQPDHSLINKLEGDEAWTRGGGAGHLFWGSATFSKKLDEVVLAGRTFGMLEVYFDDTARSHCRVEVMGVSTGAELRDRWWAQAPL
ncbi:serine/threonine-protein kinase [Nocardia inohanensis]|uniref:serine/threonine-protein kinase n=1 Tax=Nocardia inohanensis TaxID=209246 RepID=UPI00082996EF|nr:serine/threonine-protein kinase [Nocardia inohanensis]